MHDQPDRSAASLQPISDPTTILTDADRSSSRIWHRSNPPCPLRGQRTHGREQSRTVRKALTPKRKEPVTTIPTAKYAQIGGSGTWGARFPEDIELPNVELMQIYDGFDTPYGRSAPFKLLRIADQPVWRTAMHGMWDGPGARPRTALGCGQAGGLGAGTGRRRVGHGGRFRGRNPEAGQERRAPLPPWSVTVNTDFMMFIRPEDDQPFTGGRRRSARFKDPFCPIMRAHLFKAAQQERKFPHVFDSGVYVCTPWGRFETVKEIQVFADMGAHVVGPHAGARSPGLPQSGHTAGVGGHRLQSRGGAGTNGSATRRRIWPTFIAVARTTWGR